MLRIGSRGSRLALWQAEYVRRRLEAAHAGLRVEVQILHTTGDRILDVPLARIGDKGLFTKEIDTAVLERRVDAAVHSLKDLPTALEAGLALGAVLPREDPRDAWVPAPGRPATIDELPPGAVVGTSSLRRRAQLLHRRPDLRVEDLRGNLDTRLTRLAEGRFDGAILAHAGILRLGRGDAVGQLLEAPDWLPAAGQGALAVAVRDDDAAIGELVRALDDDGARLATAAERTLLRALEGGCQIPIGALARIDQEALRLDAFVASLDGAQLVRGARAGRPADAAAIGRDLAARLLDDGAAAILRAVRLRDPRDLPRASAP